MTQFLAETLKAVAASHGYRANFVQQEVPDDMVDATPAAILAQELALRRSGSQTMAPAAQAPAAPQQSSSGVQGRVVQ